MILFIRRNEGKTYRSIRDKASSEQMQEKIWTFLYYPIKLQDFQIEERPISRKFLSTCCGINRGGP
jgi:hypothetical protein